MILIDVIASNEGRAVRLYREGPIFFAIFGYLLDSGEFAASHAKPAASYRTEKGARRAAAKWTA